MVAFSRREALIDIAAGTCAGVAQVGVGHPLDTIKVRMQASGSVMRHVYHGKTPPGPAAAAGIYSFGSPLGALRTTLRLEGVRGLYKGAASPLCGAMLQNASGFFFWGLSKKLFARDVDPGTGQLSVPGLLKAGLVTGLCCLLVENPVDLVKTQMQVQLGPAAAAAAAAGGTGARHEYRGVFDAGATIVRTRGVAGLYQAVLANSLRFVPGRSVYMATFEGSFRYLRPERCWAAGENESKVASASPNAAAAATGERGERPVHADELNRFRRDYYGACFASGCIAGAAAWSLFYPFDVVRNIMMGDHIEPERRRYRGVLHCTQSLVESGGYSALWRGFIPCMLRGVPVNGCIFCVYTAVRERLEQQ